MVSEPFSGLCDCALEFKEMTTPTSPFVSQHKEHHPSSAAQRYTVTFSNLDQQQRSYCTST